MNIMGALQVLLMFSSIFIFSKGAEKLIPRGVPVSQQYLYDPLEDFTCFDGSLRIPFLFVNDDYCDCADGSDEPGTAACPNGRFHCNNAGYIPIDIPTSRVNDGICDCCDGSDEYLTESCTNDCYSLGAEAKKAAEKEAEIASKGNELRLQMIAAGKQIKQQKQERLSTLEAEKIEASRLKDEANKLKEAAEAAEYLALEAHRNNKAEEKKAEENIDQEKAKSIFHEWDSDEDGLIQFDELLNEIYFDTNKDGEVSDSEVQLFFDAGTDINWETFLAAWPKIVPYLKYDNEQNIPIDTEIREKGKENDEINVIAKSIPLEGDAEQAKGKEQYPSEGLEEEEEGHLQEQEYDEEEEEDEDKRVEETEENRKEEQYDEQTLKIIEETNQARSRFESTERSLQDVEREYTRIKDSLEKDYGPEDEFIPLDGQCYSYSDREYTYKLCPFDQVVQMGKSGGSETRLGVWAGWQEESQYNTMIYDKGQTCWNGPQRSTKVTVRCGLETAVVGASEPNKCEYELILETPAACKVPTHTQPTDIHDEF